MFHVPAVELLALSLPYQMKGRWFMCTYMIGDVVKHFRKQKKISQEELASGIMDAVSAKLKCYKTAEQHCQ